MLIAVALMFAATSLPDAEAGRKPAVSAKSKTAKKTVKKAPAKKRVAKKTTKKPKKKRRAEKAEPRRPLP